LKISQIVLLIKYNATSILQNCKEFLRFQLFPYDAIGREYDSIVRCS